AAQAEEESIPALLTALSGGNERLRRRAVEALGQIGAAQAAPALIDALRDSDEDVRRLAINALNGVGLTGVEGNREVVALLKAAICGSDELVSQSAVQILSLMRPLVPKVVPSLIAGLGHPNADVRRAIMKGLNRVGPESIQAEPESLPALASVLVTA